MNNINFQKSLVFSKFEDLKNGNFFVTCDEGSSTLYIKCSNDTDGYNAIRIQDQHHAARECCFSLRDIVYPRDLEIFVKRPQPKTLVENLVEAARGNPNA